MSLQDYHKKRDFKKTAEPKGKIIHDKRHLFVIQKHAARQLHYDFRLELQGVLLSWAVPKGPCLDPKVKRLAMHVEDHPVAYGSFEGIIPKGQYGGGTVMLWDKGSWQPLDDDPVKAYQEGHLRFLLNAHKLQGRWDLFRFKDDKHWFLVKHEDAYAKPLSDYDITQKEPNSVKTEQNLEEIKAHAEAVWTSKGASRSTKKKTIEQPSIPLPSDLEKKPLPEKISPALATLVNKIPKGSEWLHEIKFDGYRMLAFIQDQKVRLVSRNHLDWTADLQPIASALKKLPLNNTVLDGEVVLLDNAGRSDFQLLQNAIKTHEKGNLFYYLFDILYYDGFDLKSLPLIKRKEILRSLIPEKHATLCYSDHLLEAGEPLFQQACDLGLEGIVSKRLQSPYQTIRSKNWLKVKCIKRQEFVIGGYSPPKGGRCHFGSLFLGVFNEDGTFDYVGNVGTGFTDVSLATIYQQMQKLKTKKNPFNQTPPGVTTAHWLKPVLVAEVEFSAWTQDNHLRHPSFKGLRFDKKAKTIQREKPLALSALKKDTSMIQQKPKASLTITNPGKIIYPEEKLTKQDLLLYYERVAEYILPYIQNRPLTLLRCPENYKACFIQRHFNKTTPKQLKFVDIESKGDTAPYIYLDDREGLFALVQMGALEIHPWGSLVTDLERPDVIVLDLDPAPNVLWKTIVKAALDIREELMQFNVVSFVKTTGGKGLHLVIPIQPQHDWETIKHFTQLFVQYLEKKNPQRYLSTMTKSKRDGKIFVDYLRNQRSATAIGAYSTRARIHAPVSVPLAWDELTNNRKDTAFTIKTLPQRLDHLKKDPWEDFWKIKQSLPI